MLAKHWDTFLVGFIGVVGAFTLGFIWGVNKESRDYLSIKTNQRAIAADLYNEAQDNGESVCIEPFTLEGKQWVWLHSC